MARYGQSFKDKWVARLLPPESAAVEIVAREACIGVGTLLRWRERAQSGPARGGVWTALSSAAQGGGAQQPTDLSALSV